MEIKKYALKSLIILCAIISTFSTLPVIAQEKLELTGTITKHNKPLENVSVSIKELNIATYTNEFGNYKFQNLKSDKYTLIVKTLTEKEIEKIITLKSKTTIIDFNLSNTAYQLKEVKVLANRSFNQQVNTTSKSNIKGFDLPQSTTLINRELIEDQQVNKLSDIIRNVNGIALGTSRGNTTESFFARGYSLGNNSILKNGNGVNSAVMPEASTLESVEVLKGSAALLYGNVSSGAVVNMITKKPKFDFGGEFSLRSGSYDFYKPIGDIYGPINKDLAFRLVGTYENTGSFRDNVSSNKIYLSPSLLYNLGKKTTVLLQADYLRYNNTPDFGIGTLDNKIPNNISRTSFFNTPWAFNKVNQTTTSLTINHELNEKWNLNFISGYQNYDRDYFSTERIQADANGDWARRLTRVNSFENFYNGQINLNGQIKTGKISHQILLGSDANNYTTTNNSYKTFAVYDTINTINPEKYTPRTDLPNEQLLNITKSPTSRFGLYLQDLISLSQKVKILAGLRYSYQKNGNQTITNAISREQKLDKAGAKSDKAFSPRFGLVYQPNKTTSLFASYANSFEINTGTNVKYQNLAPSIVDQFELGIKKDLFDNKFSANFTVYKIINNNTTQQAEFLADGVTTNNDRNIKEFLGQTTSDGFELDLSGKIIGQLNFLAGYSYTYMRFTKTLETKNSPLLGEQFVRNVPHTANATLFYTFKQSQFKGLKLGASAFFTGDRFAGWNNKVGQSQNYNRIVPLNGFTTFDLSAGYSFKKLSLLAKISNITDVLNYTVHENYSVNPINPRQILTTISYKF